MAILYRAKKIFIAILFSFVSAVLISCGNNKVSEPSLSIQEEETTEMYLTIYGNKLEVVLENNSSVNALLELLEHEDITYTADDYGGFEKVGYIGHTLPRNDRQLTTEPGDVILYQGNQICLFVGSNSWSYTRIGRIRGYSTNELQDLLGAGKGSAQVTISLK